MNNIIESILKPEDITERVKTFQDAYDELVLRASGGDVTAADLLSVYESNANNILSPELLAYIKLSIIVTALNEGWEPMFTEGEERYYPWFDLFTQKEIDDMSAEEKGRVLGRSRYSAYAFAGVACSGTYDASTGAGTDCGGRLCFKTSKLAKYAGKQFLRLWAEFMMFTSGNNVK